MTEFELIARLTEGAPSEAADLLCGAGDDCAVISGPGGRDWLLTVDAFVENIHFRREWADLFTIGRKVISASVSDIAAMGGLPRFYLVSIGIKASDAGGAAEKIYSGMRSAAHENGVVLAGGDTALSPEGMSISVTAVGEAGHGEAILRSGARAGDAVFVTGEFGGSLAGLRCLRNGKSGGDADAFVSRHLNPSPRVTEGRAIARSRAATAMIDASDGLISDLGHVADASGLGFEIEAGGVPMDPRLPAVAESLGFDPMEAVLAGGEDYELVFTVAADRLAGFERVAKEIGAVRIGTMTADRGVRRILGKGGGEIGPLPRGFDHFVQGGSS